MPFSAWIWAALAEVGWNPGEAPGRVARARFSAASPWGSGGVLWYRHKMVGLWSYQWSQEDAELMNFTIGSSADQATFEPLSWDADMV
eukprot:5088050-Amphidinium_carterae.3